MKSYIKKIPILSNLSIRIFYYIFPLINFNIKRFLRTHNIIKNSPYNKMKEFKNKHLGERCFIIATGPSLTIEDIEKLENEITFSMNSIVLAFKDTQWRPTYYGIQDEYVYEKIKNEVDNSGLKNIFFGDSILNKFELDKNSLIFPLNKLNHNIKHVKYGSKFSNDSFSVVYDGYSITYSLLQIAVYMGFKEIYLLGTDCNYTKEQKYFKDHGHFDPTFAQAGFRMSEAFKSAKQYTQKNNVKIFNATRGGMLEVFERVDLDEVIN